MANNNINWLGNRVFEANSTHQQPRSSMNDQTPLSTTEQTPPRNSTNDQTPRYPTPTYQTPTYQAPPMEMLPEDNTNIVTPVPRPGTMAPPPQDIFGPPPVFDKNYVPGFLMSNIGKNVRAEFIMENSYVDKVGKLIEVGVNYFVLDDVNSRTHIMCDLYSVKFVTIII